MMRLHTLGTCIFTCIVNKEGTEVQLISPGCPWFFQLWGLGVSPEKSRMSKLATEQLIDKQ